MKRVFLRALESHVRPTSLQHILDCVIITQSSKCCKLLSGKLQKLEFSNVLNNLKKGPRSDPWCMFTAISLKNFR